MTARKGRERGREGWEQRVELLSGIKGRGRERQREKEGGVGKGGGMTWWDDGEGRKGGG